MRYLQVDRIDELKYFDYAIGRKAISLSDDVFEHHFPGRPIYPGAMLLESMAQLGGALIEKSLRDVRDDHARCVLSSAKSKFRGFVRPGDLVVMRATVRSHHEDAAMVAVRAEVDTKRVAEAELLYVYLRIDSARLEEARVDYLETLTRETEVIE